MRVTVSECVLDVVFDFSDLSAVENVYRVHELTEGAFLHYFWHKISITKMPLSQDLSTGASEKRAQWCYFWHR